MKKFILTLACALLLPALAFAQGLMGTNVGSATPTVLTDGATITVPCPAINSGNTYSLLLTGNGHQVLFPSCAASSNGNGFTFIIANGCLGSGNPSPNCSGATGPYTGLIFGPGYNWTNNIPYALCTGAAAPSSACTAAATAGQVDDFGCVYNPLALTSPIAHCWADPPQYALSSGFTVVNSASCASSAGAACTTSPVDMTGTDLLLVCLGSYTGSSATSVPSDSQTNTYTQVYTADVSSASTRGRLYYSRTTNVTNTMTFTASAGGTAYPALAVIGVSGSVTSPLDQVSTPTVSGSTSGPISPGSITPSQPAEILATCLAGAGGTISIASPFTLGPSVPGSATHTIGASIAYQIQTAAAAENPAWSWTGGVASVVAGQASFK